MSKQYTVRSHKRREHIVNHVENIAQFCQSLESWGDKTMYVWKEKGETKTLTFAEFTALVYRFSDGLLRTCAKGEPSLAGGLNENIRIGIIANRSINPVLGSARPYKPQFSERIDPKAGIVASVSFFECRGYRFAKVYTVVGF